MRSLIDFVYITLADFIVRVAYQMGKTPLLPIFAATLGATDAFLGFIVSVSTIAGILFKPLIGILSDRWGRRWWLIIGTTFFAGVPFLYYFIHGPEQLLVIRLIHGCATAIYGPVTVAYVVEQKRDRRAERLGWFSMARSGGYILGPALAGWLLLVMKPIDIFMVIGILSSFAFVPVLLLSDSKQLFEKPKPRSIPQQIFQALKFGSLTPAVWLSGSLEFTVYIALYAAKVFLPIYSLSMGINVALVGTFFALQEAIYVFFKPLGGRLGDRYGYLKTISIGMANIGCMLPLLTLTSNSFSLLLLAAFIGSSQALIFPSTIILISNQINEEYIGAGIGLVGMLKNSGKVIGPILGGLLVGWFSFAVMFWILGSLLILGALVVHILANRLYGNTKEVDSYT